MVHAAFSSSEKAQEFIDRKIKPFPRDWQWDELTVDEESD